jgi:hypothetical protein
MSNLRFIAEKDKGRKRKRWRNKINTKNQQNKIKKKKPQINIET